MTKLKKILAGVAGAAVVVGVAGAAGLWPGFPVVGGAAYCASIVNGTCAQTVPAGPTTFYGTEYSPFDTSPLGTNPPVNNTPATVQILLTQLGQGPYVDLTTVATSQTIPNNTPFYFLDGAQGSALTVTMPASAVEGQIQYVVCEAATVGTLTVAANTGQTLKGNPNAACVAGVGYKWRYAGANSTWYRF